MCVLARGPEIEISGTFFISVQSVRDAITLTAGRRRLPLYKNVHTFTTFIFIYFTLLLSPYSTQSVLVCVFFSLKASLYNVCIKTPDIRTLPALTCCVFLITNIYEFLRSSSKQITKILKTFITQHTYYIYKTHLHTRI